MHQIVVVAEPNDSRPIYLWRLLGLQLMAAGTGLRPHSAPISVDGDGADE